jgi:hypothetical protein
MKVYVLINSNHEGFNFLGVFDSKEKAEEAGSLYRARRDARIKEDWHEPNLAYDELQEQLDFDRDWYCHEIYEYTMNDLVGK